jgi:hypothetical protein
MKNSSILEKLMLPKPGTIDNNAAFCKKLHQGGTALPNSFLSFP